MKLHIYVRQEMDETHIRDPGSAYNATAQISIRLYDARNYLGKN